MIVLFRFFES